MAITPNGQFAYVANQLDGTVSVINTATNAVVGAPITVGSLPEGVVTNGQFVYVANDGGGTVSVIDTASNTLAETISFGSSTALTYMAITPDGQYVYVGSFTGTSGVVYVIDTASNTLINTIALGATVHPRSVAITPDGQFAYVTDQNRTVMVIATQENTNAAIRNTVVGTIPIAVGSIPWGVTINGQFAYVANVNNGTVSVIDTANNTVVKTITVGASPRFIAITPDGKFAYVTNSNDGAVSVIDTASSTVVNTITVGAGPTAISITPDGKFAYVTNITDNTVSVIALGTAITANLPGGTPGASYTGTVTATDPSGSTFTYAVTDGSLPPGVTLDPATGKLTGAPTTADNYTFTVTATATEPVHGLTEAIEQQFTLAVLPAGTVNTLYTDTLPVPHDVSTSFTCALTAGSLPQGVTLDTSTCQLSGTPTTPGGYDFTVTSTSTVNGQPQTTVQRYLLRVGGGASAAAGIPTLGDMALVLLALLLGASAVVVKRRGY